MACTELWQTLSDNRKRLWFTNLTNKLSIDFQLIIEFPMQKFPPPPYLNPNLHNVIGALQFSRSLSPRRGHQIYLSPSAKIHRRRP